MKMKIELDSQMELRERNRDEKELEGGHLGGKEGGCSKLFLCMIEAQQ